MGSAMWTLSLIENEIQLSTFCDMFPENNIKRFQNGNCFVSYTLFYDTDMRFVFYSSPRIQMNKSEYFDSFCTPDEYMEKYDQALAERKVSKIVMHFELHLPLKYFLRPFDDPSSYLSKRCKGYPKDPKTDYKFAFLNQR
uniref:Uncharacterized protein n=1 Tax=Panagrolaimus superbus TaxID=310955 RepID=A0A914XX78_9BILA